MESRRMRVFPFPAVSSHHPDEIKDRLGKSVLAYIFISAVLPGRLIHVTAKLQ